MNKENNTKLVKGLIKFKVTNVNDDKSEIGGVFVSEQPSVTDFNSKNSNVPKTLNVTGKW